MCLTSNLIGTKILTMFSSSERTKRNSTTVASVLIFWPGHTAHIQTCEWYSMVMSLGSLSFEMGSTVFCFTSSSPASEMSGQRMYYQQQNGKHETRMKERSNSQPHHTNQDAMSFTMLPCTNHTRTGQNRDIYSKNLQNKEGTPQVFAHRTS